MRRGGGGGIRPVPVPFSPLLLLLLLGPPSLGRPPARILPLQAAPAEGLLHRIPGRHHPYAPQAGAVVAPRRNREGSQHGIGEVPKRDRGGHVREAGAQQEAGGDGTGGGGEGRRGSGRGGTASASGTAPGTASGTVRVADSVVGVLAEDGGAAAPHGEIYVVRDDQVDQPPPGQVRQLPVCLVGGYQVRDRLGPEPLQHCPHHLGPEGGGRRPRPPRRPEPGGTLLQVSVRAGSRLGRRLLPPSPPPTDLPALRRGAAPVQDGQDVGPALGAEADHPSHDLPAAAGHVLHVARPRVQEGPIPLRISPLRMRPPPPPVPGRGVRRHRPRELGPAVRGQGPVVEQPPPLPVRGAGDPSGQIDGHQEPPPPSLPGGHAGAEKGPDIGHGNRRWGQAAVQAVHSHGGNDSDPALVLCIITILQEEYHTN